MSREIYRRAHRTGLVSADIFRPGVDDLTELAALAPNDVWDGTLIHVRDDNTIYAYDLESVDADDGLNVITPATGTGRWLKIGFGGAGSGSSADKWVDVTKIVENEVIVVDRDGAADWPQEVRRELIDATETGALLQIDEGYAIIGPQNLAETLDTYNHTQGNDIEFTAGDNLIIHQNAPPATGAGQGSFFVGDGTGGTSPGQPYFREENSGAVSQLNLGSAADNIVLAAYDYSSTTVTLTPMAAGDVVVQIFVEVSAAFDQPNALISVGTTSAPADMVPTSSVNLGATGISSFKIMSAGVSSDDVIITINSAGSTVGAGRISAFVFRS